ncbi:MAG: sigma-70 family RNA polymerase sigma factor [Planctomycetota bacterium]|jgi:RNA polymerase sigma-70 factor (ECF subfamily)
MDEPRLEELVRRAQAGDRAAAGELAQRYEDRVKASIRRRLAPDLRQRVDTDDIFQSTIAASLEDLVGFKYEGEKALVAWLTSVAERRLISAARRHRAGKRDVRRHRPLAAAGSVAGNLTSPTRGAVRAETKASIQRAVARLPAIERRVVELRSYEGLAFREIAERLELADKHAAREVFLSALRKIGDLFES